MGAGIEVFTPNEWPSAERIFVFCLRFKGVYTSIERIQISPPKGRWLALRTRAIAIWGDGQRRTCRRPEMPWRPCSRDLQQNPRLRSKLQRH
jgi:hypothetical protein